MQEKGKKKKSGEDHTAMNKGKANGQKDKDKESVYADEEQSSS